ncbi:hypothetical protein [Massilia phosphatilytica]
MRSSAIAYVLSSSASRLLASSACSTPPSSACSSSQRGQAGDVVADVTGSG